jgi:hypothetical protein
MVRKEGIPEGDLGVAFGGSVRPTRRGQTVYPNILDQKREVSFKPLGFVARGRCPLAATELSRSL